MIGVERVNDIPMGTPPRCPDCCLLMQHTPSRGWRCRMCGPWVPPEVEIVDLDELLAGAP